MKIRTSLSLAVGCLALAGTTYAVGLNDVLPAATLSRWHVPEAGVLAFQGIMLFVLAGAMRRQHKSGSELESVRPVSRVALR